MWEKAFSGYQSVEKLILSNDKCLIINFACFFAHVLFSPFFLRECILFQMSLFWVKNFIKVRRKKTVLSSKTLPGSSLRARSLTAPPHPTLPPIPAARNLARRLDRPSLSPSLPFPFPSHPSALYLSTYLPTPLSLSIYREILLSADA